MEEVVNEKHGRAARRSSIWPYKQLLWPTHDPVLGPRAKRLGHYQGGEVLSALDSCPTGVAS